MKSKVRGDGAEPMGVGTGHMCLFCLLVVVGLTTSTASAQSALNVEQAVSAATARPVLDALERASRAEERARGETFKVWKNPTVSYQREELLDTDQDDSEDIIALSQEFKLSGKAALMAEAAAQREAAAALNITLKRHEIVTMTRIRFWAVVHAQHHHDVSEKWLATLARANTMLEERERSGESSLLDRKRLALENVTAARHAAEAALTREDAWARLLEMTGPIATSSAWPRVDGQLTPAREEAIALSMMTQRADVQAWRHRAAAAAAEVKAAEQGWVPKLVISAGYKAVQRDDARHHGYAAGISLSLPLFDRGDAEATLARHQRDYAQAMGEHLTEEASRARSALVKKATGLIYLAQQSRSAYDEHVGPLEAMANLALASGETSLSDWIAIHRSARDETHHVALLMWRARGAVEALRAAATEDLR